MAKYYVTVGDSMGQATTTFASVQTLPDGGTLSSIKVPPDMKKISVLGSCLSSDVISVIDVGNNFTVQLSGTGLVDGIQEFNIGALFSGEVGASVGMSWDAQPANYRNVDVAVKPGEIVVSCAYDGTDPGTPFVAVTLGFE
mgnify:CR=1 FL=1